MNPEHPKLKVAVTGSGGLIGTRLCSLLESSGHTVLRLVRSGSMKGPGTVFWNPESGAIEQEELEGADAVVHLAGEGIASARWSEDVKRRIKESRIKGTALICETIQKLANPPKVLVSASAVGIYGDGGRRVFTEDSPPGSGFLPDLAVKWEEITHSVQEKGVRVVNLRTGLVLSPDGGVLGRMLLPFRLGVGGKLGDGRHYMSWIAIDDLLKIIVRCLTDASLHGPLNATSPNPVTNAEFTRVLAKVLHRPAVFSVPRMVLKLLFGDMADEALLSSINAIPKKLFASGHQFLFEDLEAALRYLLRRERK